MDIILQPGKLSGQIVAIPSKSMTHRALICAAFAKEFTTLLCTDGGEDVAATCACLRALGAQIQRNEAGYIVQPIRQVAQEAVLPCKESGATLRFLLPIVGALGIDATFVLEGRLPQRPLSPLWEEMERMGCALTRPAENTIRCTGKLQPGHYRMDGGVSSQFISGLLLALPLIQGESSLEITGNIESRPYIEMTRYVLDQFQNCHNSRYAVEGDWSNAAFWLAANTLGSQIAVLGLQDDSCQGDQIIHTLLSNWQDNIVICAADIPDLVPILAVVAAAKGGATFTGIRRLRMKESDRVASIIAMLQALGGNAEATEDTLTVYGTGLNGGIVDSFGDHRMVMSAAIAATICKTAVTILGAECVKKSYPTFWEDVSRLGGNYGEYLR